MRKLRQHTGKTWKTSFLGFAVVVASILCFLLFLCVIIILVRSLLG